MKAKIQKEQSKIKDYCLNYNRRTNIVSKFAYEWNIGTYGVNIDHTVHGQIHESKTMEERED